MMNNYKTPQCNPEIKSSKLQWSNMVMASNSDNCSFLFTIVNFSILEKKNGRCIFTPTFAFENDVNAKWCLKIYPNGNTKECEGWLSIFLLNESSKSLKVYFTIGIIDSNNIEIFKHEAYSPGKMAKLFEPNDAFGFNKFKEVNDLLQNKNNLLPNDTLSILCTITSAVENITNYIYLGQQKMKYTVDAELPNNRLKNLQSEEEFKDFSFLVDGKEIKVHKCVIAAFSPVFNAMFHSNLRESRDNFVEISDTPFEIIKEMINFIYSGKVENLDYMAAELLPVAEKYDLEDLKTLCERSLLKNVNQNNVLNILLLADIYKLEDVKAVAMNFVVRNRDQLIRTTEYQNLIDNHPKLIIETFSLNKRAGDISKDDEPKTKKLCSDFSCKVGTINYTNNKMMNSDEL